MHFPQHVIHRIWQRHGLLGALGWLALVPAACGFSLIVRGRNRLYDRRWLAVHAGGLQVISVGNLSVGGTGKTPMVLWLAQALQSRGHKVGILTRGYRGGNTGLTVVGVEGQPLATPEAVGDEPVMLARSFPGVVIAGRDRVAGAQLAREQFGLELVILDDGFQHRRLDRQVDLLLVNGGSGNSNAGLLPAGPFREPFSAARRADIALVTKSAQKHEGNARFQGSIKRALGDGKPVYYGHLQPVILVSAEQRQWRELPLTALSGKRILALTGIADPSPFYQSLHEWEAEITEVMEFPDHHQYVQADWQRISLAGQKVDMIVTTEKDLVKLERFPFAMGKLVALRVRMAIEHDDRLLTDIEHLLTKAE